MAIEDDAAAFALSDSMDFYDRFRFRATATQSRKFARTVRVNAQSPVPACACAASSPRFRICLGTLETARVLTRLRRLLYPDVRRRQIADAKAKLQFLLRVRPKSSHWCPCNSSRSCTLRTYPLRVREARSDRWFRTTFRKFTAFTVGNNRRLLSAGKA